MIWWNCPKSNIFKSQNIANKYKLARHERAQELISVSKSAKICYCNSATCDSKMAPSGNTQHVTDVGRHDNGFNKEHDFL